MHPPIVERYVTLNNGGQGRTLKDLKGAYHPHHASKAGQGWGHGHGQENPRRYYQPDLIRRWTLDRGSSATHHRSGGNQPAYQSMINRRFMIVPPALAEDDLKPWRRDM